MQNAEQRGSCQVNVGDKHSPMSNVLRCHLLVGHWKSGVRLPSGGQWVSCAAASYPTLRSQSVQTSVISAAPHIDTLQVLGDISGEELRVGCKEVFDSGILSKVAVAGLSSETHWLRASHHIASLSSLPPRSYPHSPTHNTWVMQDRFLVKRLRHSTAHFGRRSLGRGTQLCNGLAESFPMNCPKTARAPGYYMYMESQL